MHVFHAGIKTKSRPIFLPVSLASLPPPPPSRRHPPPPRPKREKILTCAYKRLSLMPKLGNYITGAWITGDGDGQPLYNAFSGELIGHASTKGLDFAAILDYARTTGNPALRRMTFPERGRMLRALAMHL